MSSLRTVYLDYAATSPMRPEAVAAMLPYLTDRYGNPSGSHAVARRARASVEDARERMAVLLGCRPGEVVFTSGGTEADNLAVAGTLAATGGRALCSAVEHHAVLDTVAACGGSTVPVDGAGRVDLDALAAALDPEVRVVSVMLANNEVGTVQSLAAVADVVRAGAPDAVVHTDAVAAAPTLDLAEEAATAALVSVSAHKFGGPQGVGALVVREGTLLRAVVHGGGQERERRPGTHNVAGIVGMAAALEAAAGQRASEVERLAGLRDRLADGLAAGVEGVRRTVPTARTVPGSCHLRIDGVEQEDLLMLLDEANVCASGGSACASGALEPSHVLLAMGCSMAEARQAIRFSLGWTTTEEDVDIALEIVPKAVAQLRR